MNLQRKVRVCIIGGGAAGLCALRNFAANLNEFEIEAFEKMEEVGGTWIYNEKTGLDLKGLPIHSSMYRDLRTNLPCEVMNFPDYRKMKGNKSSTVTHQQVLAYLKDYAKHFQLCQFIQFNMIVEHVQPEIIETDNKCTIWKVQVKDLGTNQIFHKQFDAVIVCTGIVSILPPTLTQISAIKRIEGSKVFFENSNFVLADTIIYCTGYLISFPFLDPSCGITVDENYVFPVYKHMINIKYPTMCFLGLNYKVVPFPMFQMKAQYFLALLKGRACLPSKDEMFEDSKCKTEKKRHAHLLGAQQWSYNNNIAQAGRFDPLPPIYQVAYEAWSKLRASNLWQYKDYKLVITDDDKSVEIILQ